jgi:hypothetical protein
MLFLKEGLVERIETFPPMESPRPLDVKSFLKEGLVERIETTRYQNHTLRANDFLKEGLVERIETQHTCDDILNPFFLF